MRDRKLYLGDNLDVLRTELSPESVDLVYLDPPFNSDRQYNVIFREDQQPAAQARAFHDSWRWGPEAAVWYEEGMNYGGRIAETLVGLRRFLNQSNLMAYLAMLAPRLIELRRVLRPDGSLVLHCDPTAGHYVKILLDAIFGPENFRNELVWCYRGGGVPRNAFARKHDTLFWYAKSSNAPFFPQYEPYSAASQQLVRSRGGVSIDGRQRDLERGAHMTDWWSDINSLQTWSPERLGYPTQKPRALLERVIKALSREGSTVLDPFCGCGTTVAAAEALNRNWVGIDIAVIAISVIERMLQDDFGLRVHINGIPADFESARALARRDPFQFEAWAVSKITHLRPNKTQVGDRGVDGVGWFNVTSDSPSKIVAQVKGGQVGPAAVRDLLGTMQAEHADLGVLIVMDRITPHMAAAAASAGVYSGDGTMFARPIPRIQIASVHDHFDGRHPVLPPMLRIRPRAVGGGNPEP